MSFINRLDKIETGMKLHKYQKLPDWNQFGDLQYKIGYLNHFHFINNIECFVDSKKVLDKYLKWNLVTQTQYDLFINAETELWRQAGLTDNPVFFVSSL